VLAYAASVGAAGAELLQETGNWRVMRVIDSMSDNVSCYARNIKNGAVQMEATALYVNYRGRGQLGGSYRFRLGDGEAGTTQQLVRDTRGLSLAVLLKGDFKAALAAKRLRVRADIPGGPAIEDDIDLDGAAAAHAAILGPQCKGKVKT
jgi:hypothetical protein